MASQALNELREIYSKYLSARQKRYDEIAEILGGGHPIQMHQKIIEILDRELNTGTELIDSRYDN